MTTNIRKGDKVRYTIVAISGEDTTDDAMKEDGWSWDPISETVEVLERPNPSPGDRVRLTVHLRNGDTTTYEGDVDSYGTFNGSYWLEEPYGDVDAIAESVSWVRVFPTARNSRKSETPTPDVSGNPSVPPPAEYTYFRDRDGDVWKTIGGNQVVMWDGCDWEDPDGADLYAVVEDCYCPLTPVTPAELTTEQREASK